MSISSNILSQPLAQLGSEMLHANDIIGKFKNGQVGKNALEEEVGRINKSLDFVEKVFQKIQDKTVGRDENLRLMETLQQKISALPNTINDTIEETTWNKMNVVEWCAKKVWKGICGCFGRTYKVSTPISENINVGQFQQLITAVKTAKPAQVVSSGQILAGGPTMLGIEAPPIRQLVELREELKLFFTKGDKGYNSPPAAVETFPNSNELEQLGQDLDKSELTKRDWIAVRDQTPPGADNPLFALEIYKPKSAAGAAGSAVVGDAKAGFKAISVGENDGYGNMAWKGSLKLGMAIVGAGVGIFHGAVAGAVAYKSGHQRNTEQFFVSVDSVNGQHKVCVTDMNKQLLSSFNSVEDFVESRYVRGTATLNEVEDAAAEAQKPKAAPKPQPAAPKLAAEAPKPTAQAPKAPTPQRPAAPTPQLKNPVPVATPKPQIPATPAPANAATGPQLFTPGTKAKMDAEHTAKLEAEREKMIAAEKARVAAEPRPAGAPQAPVQPVASTPTLARAPAPQSAAAASVSSQSPKAAVPARPDWLDALPNRKPGAAEFSAAASKLNAQGISTDKEFHVLALGIAQVTWANRTVGAKKAINEAIANLKNLPIMQHFWMVDLLNQPKMNKTTGSNVLNEFNARLQTCSESEKVEIRGYVEREQAAAGKESDAYKFYDKIRI